MKKTIVSLFLIIVIISMALPGCKKNQPTFNPEIFVDDTFNIGMLVPDESGISQQMEKGFMYADSIASYVNINSKEIYNYFSIFNYASSDVVSYAEQLVEENVSVIIFYSEDVNVFNTFIDYIKDTNIPVLSLSPFTCDYERCFSIALSTEYKASSAATYAMDQGYSKGVVLCENDNGYNKSFADVFKNTFKSYIGTEPTVYYQSGELANYSDSALVNGGYDYLLLLCSSENRLSTVNHLRNQGFQGEIMFDEVLDHTTPRFSSSDNCAFITKLETDTSNNISTVFYSQFSEYADINQSSVTSAAAYGYDAYMTIFEALKSFGDTDSSSIFKNDTTSTPVIEKITLADFVDAMKNVVYYGVTDTITFKNNISAPSYIYIDTIADSKTSLCKKYTFSE